MLSLPISLAALALASNANARPIPHTVSVFRRAFLNANEGILIVQNEPAPSTYLSVLEPYDQFHFRYTAIQCDEQDGTSAFYNACCRPRLAESQGDEFHPVQCNLPAYQIFNPVYGKDQVVAKLGYAPASEEGPEMDVGNFAGGLDMDHLSALVQYATTASESSAPAPSSSTWSSSSEVWTSSSSESVWSSSSTWSPAPAPSSSSWSSSETPSSSWVPPPPSSSSSSWTPEWTPSSSSWVAPSSSATPAAENPKYNFHNAYAAPAPAPSSSSPPAPAPAAPAPASGSEEFTGGRATWFTQNNRPGACGVYHSDSDYIVAIQVDRYGWTGQKSPDCGRSITITNTNTGATAVATVADACPGCINYNSLDLSTGLFQALGSLDQGVLPIAWHFN